MNKKAKNILRFAGFGTIGGLCGFAYYYFIGCTSGHCPLTSNWEVTTIYGLVSGLIIGIPTKKKTISE